ncbi:hypothetical protein K435DRAFT_861209 [Dendrothele bispora CBS 962.96]|uniref:Uncharacterized protein n=1 Tax=Dendrothele bispora (strain CBS 962.96) TaxID=1314807 RepID=A0A4S8LVS6_DENBC|nr:hypothetical protein K435DRAFT_861209 [Dendrothele bispora CBS 962.96]
MSDSGAALWKLALVESDLVPANYSSIVPRTYYLIPDIPMGRQAGLRWITESLRVSIDRGNTSSVPFWGDMFEPGAKNGRHLLVEALEVREEVRGRLLRWDSDESFQFDVDSLENLDWPGIQATRCRDGRYPLPHFSGVEVQMRRVHVSRLLRECIAALEDAESELIETALLRREILIECTMDGFQEKSSKLFLDCKNANEQRLEWRRRYIQLRTAFEDLLYLTGVSLIFLL